MSRILDTDAEVVHEEIIVHPTVIWTGKLLKGEARISGKVVIDGIDYTFEKVVQFDYKRPA